MSSISSDGKIEFNWKPKDWIEPLKIKIPVNSKIIPVMNWK